MSQIPSRAREIQKQKRQHTTSLMVVKRPFDRIGWDYILKIGYCQFNAASVNFSVYFRSLKFLVTKKF